MPDLTLGWSVKCLFVIQYRELVPFSIILDSPIYENLLIYFHCGSPNQSCADKNSYIIAISHVEHLTRAAFTPIICICDGLNVSILLHFFTTPFADKRVRRIFKPRERSTCQCSGEQPALDRFRSGNSLDDKARRRSTRWPTPAHFLFKSASTPGSCKLFPARKGAPCGIVLIVIGKRNALAFFPHQECHQAECVATARGGDGGMCCRCPEY